MPSPQYERLILDPAGDTLRIVLVGGMTMDFDISPEQMSTLCRWAFTRKTVHIIEGVRRVEPFTPITH